LNQFRQCFLENSEASAMSLHPQSVHTVPEETARVARQVFFKGNRYLLLRDEAPSTRMLTL